MMTNANEWRAAKATATRVVVAPGARYLTETAYQPDGSKVVRVECHGDRYVTVTKYPR